MASWVYDEKFLTDMQFLFRTLPFIAGEDDDLEHPAQEQEKRRTTMTSFEFPRGLNNSAATFQAAVSQLATTDPIDSPARPPIVTPSMTT
jgi:hypothetical protein